MEIVSRPELAESTITEALERANADYVSAGTAVAQIKELTLCTRSDHRALTSDLRWVAVGDLSVGDKLIGFDEEPEPMAQGRRYKQAVVESVRSYVAETWRVVLGDGTEIITTPDHQWLAPRTGLAHNGWAWRRTDHLLAHRWGSRPVLHRLVPLFEPATDYESGWLAGMMEGGGSINPRAVVTIAQRPGPVFDRLARALAAKSIPFHAAVATYQGLGRGDGMVATLRGQVPSRLAVLGTLRPERLIAKLDPDSFGCVEQRQHDHLQIVSVEPAGEAEVTAVGTSTRTLIIEGFPMHNCLTKSWLERMAVKEGIDTKPLYAERDGDRAFALQILAGIGYERLLFRRPGPRVEIQSPFGPISGRIDYLPSVLNVAQLWEIPWELKVTWASLRKDLDDQAQYVEQVAGYALALGVERGLLFVLNIAGDRTPRNLRPYLRALELSWTKDELLSFKEELFRRTAIVLGPTIPPKADKYIWECVYCPHNPKLGGACPNAGAPGKTRGFFTRSQLMPGPEDGTTFTPPTMSFGLVVAERAAAKLLEQPGQPGPSGPPELAPKRRIRRPLG